MFKKRTIIKKASARRRRDDKDPSGEDQPDQEDDSLLHVIDKTKRKRQLLTELQYKRGTDASELLLASTSSSSTTTTEIPSTDTTTDQQLSVVGHRRETVLEQKQRQAMEEFIQNRMSKKSEPDPASSTPATTSNSLSAEELFEQLASEANALQAMTDPNSSTTVADHQEASDQAVVLHGTGIAEVILPVHQRAEQTSALAQAADAAKRTYKARGGVQSSTSMPNRFRTPSTMRSDPIPVGSKGDNASTAAAVTDTSDDRPGFAALRQKQRPSSNKRKDAPSGRDRASDDQVFKKFVTHQRDNQRR